MCRSRFISREEFRASRSLSCFGNSHQKISELRKERSSSHAKHGSFGSSETRSARRAADSRTRGRTGSSDAPVLRTTTDRATLLGRASSRPHLQSRSLLGPLRAPRYMQTGPLHVPSLLVPSAFSLSLCDHLLPIFPFFFFLLTIARSLRSFRFELIVINVLQRVHRIRIHD